MPIGPAYGDGFAGNANPSANSTVYFQGDADRPSSWRGIVVEDGLDKLAFEHSEPLTDTNVTLDEAKVTAVEGAGHSISNIYFANVLTDTRSNQNLPAGIAGDMTGLHVLYDGFTWLNFPDEWVEKGFFSQSFQSDHSIFRRMNVIDTDPDDRTAYPPTPEEGVSIGSRNTRADGQGIEMLSLTNNSSLFGMVPEVLHGPLGISDDAIDNIIATLSDDLTVVSASYNSLHRTNTVYEVGDIVVQRGERFVCNTAGLQDGDFADFLDRWDADLILPNFNIILVGEDGDVVSGEDGNVLRVG